jgi:uncharacterized membrane protein
MPTTPNPSTGFLLMYKEEELVFTDYPVESAFQFLISAGVINIESSKEHIPKDTDKIQQLIKENKDK